MANKQHNGVPAKPKISENQPVLIRKRRFKDFYTTWIVPNRPAIFLTVFSFLVLTVCGQIFLYSFTQYTNNKKAQVTAHQENVKAATGVFYDISATFSKRHYHALHLWGGYADNMPEEDVKEREKAYRNMVTYWNENRLVNLALLRRYYGQEMHDKFLQVVVTKFHQVHQELIEIQKNRHKFKGYFSDYNRETATHLAELDDVISNYSDDMQAILDQEDVDKRFPPKKMVSPSPTVTPSAVASPTPIPSTSLIK